jgi:F420-dependent hydroxymycolic acid dehydrogenase
LLFIKKPEFYKIAMTAQVLAKRRYDFAQAIDPNLEQRDEKKSVYYVLSSEQFPTPELIEYGIAAEEAGFDGVWTSDHFQPWQANEAHSGSAWVMMAALSQRTSRITFGTGVTCPTFRYRPAIVAQVWATLSLLAPSRVFLGIGAGENLNEGAAGGGWGAYGERASRLIEAVNIIRSLWSGEHVNIKGKYWQVEGRLYDPPRSQIPLYIAAGGPKSGRLAGLYGDGMITGAGLLKKNKDLRNAWEDGLQEAGKDRKSQALIVEHWAVVGDGEDEQVHAAANKWRFLPKAWELGYFDNISPEEIQARAEKEIPPEKTLEDWAISKNPDEHSKAIQELYDLGATHVVVHVATPNQKEVIDFFGTKVIPSLRKSSLRISS